MLLSLRDGEQVDISRKTRSWSRGLHPRGTGAVPVRDTKIYAGGQWRTSSLPSWNRRFRTSSPAPIFSVVKTDLGSDAKRCRSSVCHLNLMRWRVDSENAEFV